MEPIGPELVRRKMLLNVALIVVGSSVVAVRADFTGLWIAGVEPKITAMMGMVMIVGIATEMSSFLVSAYQLQRH